MMFCFLPTTLKAILQSNTHVRVCTILEEEEEDSSEGENNTVYKAIDLFVVNLAAIVLLPLKSTSLYYFYQPEYTIHDSNKTTHPPELA